MRINVAIPESSVDAPVLDAALESVTRLNESLLNADKVPTFEEARQQNGVVWRPEPPGEEHFDHAARVVRRGWGDCDDLAPWQAASLRHTGEDPDAIAVVKKSGPKRWHAVVRRGDGSIDDPSKRAGMRPGIAAGVYGAALPLMYTAPSAVVGGAYIVRPAIAMREFRGGVQARADMPWNWREHLDDKPRPTDYAMATLHSAPLASTALTGAIVGALELAVAGGYADPSHISRLAAIADAIDGVPFEEIAACYGEEHAVAAEQVVGSFFGKAWRKAKKMAGKGLKFATRMVPGADLALKFAGSGLGKKLISFVPGIGPIATSALEVLPEITSGYGPVTQSQLIRRRPLPRSVPIRTTPVRTTPVRTTPVRTTPVPKPAPKKKHHRRRNWQRRPVVMVKTVTQTPDWQSFQAQPMAPFQQQTAPQAFEQPPFESFEPLESPVELEESQEFEAQDVEPIPGEDEPPADETEAAGYE